MQASRLGFFVFILFFSFQGLSDGHQQWSRSRLIDHLSESKRTSVANFSETLGIIKEKLASDKLSEKEVHILDAWTKQLLTAQETYLKTVHKYKKDFVGDALEKSKELTVKEIKQAKKHDELIGMYQANISELESVLKAIQKHIHTIQK